RRYLVVQLAHARDIAARSAESVDETKTDRIPAYFENNWNGCGSPFGDNCCRSRGHKDHCHLTTDQIGRQRGQPLVLIVSEAIFNRDVLAFHKTCIFQTLTKR